MDPELLALLCCPGDQAAPLRVGDDALSCPACDTSFPVVDGIVVFLSAQQLSDSEEREKEFRGAESAEYDDLYAGYTDAVEVPSVMRRVGRPAGPVLDAGCGTGRITRALVDLGQPVVAVDYSDACLRRMLERCAGARVLAVQSDLRSIPVRSGVMAAATCMEVHQHVRDADRPRLVAELARVLAPGAALVISTFKAQCSGPCHQGQGRKPERPGRVRSARLIRIHAGPGGYRPSAKLTGHRCPVRAMG